ncbi:MULTISPECIES: DUF5677 domain-containing protein [unclassified Xanthomonas]|uniref:DUF5677 domain-containing protein n=1 Tax=Xanthomonas sp. LMG 9002 TaxID=1591158 RepID=UPI00136E49B3|nr:DUF5677 domain-containing protein [Xanthomonas sp. LMG 9002]MXV06521.1 hypothetical protein [Xanthomonas sp. LMG 9002]
MTPLTQQTIALVTQQLREVGELIGAMRPPLKPPGRPQCALFLTIAEQFEATVRLAQAGLLTHSAVHVRSMLEALADLYLLARDVEHVDRMKHKQLHGEKSFYDSIREALQDDVRNMIDTRLVEVEKRYAPLHARFKRKRSQADTFAAADLRVLIGPYTLLCSYAHSDLTALAQRHQGQHGMAHRAEVPNEIAFLILSLASMALMQATLPIKEIAKFPDGKFDTHFQCMDRLYGKLMELRPAKGIKAD